MKATDLMIGDWVRVPSELNRTKKIYSTFDLDVALLYEPIPLTPEILEKNGFIKENNRCWVLSDKHTGDQIIALFEVAKGFAMPTSGLAIGFQEVHKLQHLLKLYGIDKEIELP